MLGEAEYAFTVFSWSIVIGPPANAENTSALITSAGLSQRQADCPNSAQITPRAVHDRPAPIPDVGQAFHAVIARARNRSGILVDAGDAGRPAWGRFDPGEGADR